VINQEVITIQGRMFRVERKLPQHRINLKEGNAKDLKIFFHCDTIFKSQGLIWFCNEIPIVEYE